MFDFWNNKEIRLPVDKLQNAIKESREIRELDKNFFRSVSELRNNLSRLYDSISALNSKTTENKYSNIVKNKFCARSMELLNGVEYPESIVTAEDFCDTLRDKLDELASLNIKEFRHLNAFKEEMKSVAEGIKIAGNNVNTIGQILNYPVSKRAAEVWKTIEEMKNLESAIADMENQINSINSRIDETEKILKMKRKELQQALQSSDYMRAEMVRKEMEKLKQNAKTIETKISEEFASIERIFRKFAHFNTYEKELVDKYISDGFAAFLDDEEGKIKIILDKMRIAVETGKIPIESRKHQKLLDIIRSMSLFESLRRQYKEIKSQLEQLMSDMPSVEKDIGRLNSEIEDGEHAIVKLRKELESRNKSIDEAIRKVEELKGDLVDSVSGILGKKVVIEN